LANGSARNFSCLISPALSRITFGDAESVDDCASKDASQPKDVEPLEDGLQIYLH